MSTPAEELAEAGWEPTRWYQVWQTDGSLWCETSSPWDFQDPDGQSYPIPQGARLVRLYERKELQEVPVDPQSLEPLQGVRKPMTDNEMLKFLHDAILAYDGPNVPVIEDLAQTDEGLIMNVNGEPYEVRVEAI